MWTNQSPRSLHAWKYCFYSHTSLTVWMSIKFYTENNFSSKLQRHWFIIFYHPLLGGRIYQQTSIWCLFLCRWPSFFSLEGVQICFYILVIFKLQNDVFSWVFFIFIVLSTSWALSVWKFMTFISGKFFYYIFIWKFPPTYIL